MSSPAERTSAPADPGTRSGDNLRYYERSRFSRGFKNLALGFTLAAIYIVISGLIDGTFRADLSKLILYLTGWLVLVAVFAWAIEFRHLRVDDDGLWIGRHTYVPASEIGEAIVVSGEEARSIGWGTKVFGVKLHWMYGVPQYQRDPFVLLVRDRPGLRRPGIALMTKDPVSLAAALNELRQDVRGEPRVRRPEYVTDRRKRRRRHLQPGSRSIRRRMRRKARAFHDPPGPRGGRDPP